ncbi:MAG: ankyrin repeat domain-containing protein [Epsilonproteobacteria bacterium]|nr:ankyrin repeat domain-containing protein [Campylobacterota bacterium]
MNKKNILLFSIAAALVTTHISAAEERRTTQDHVILEVGNQTPQHQIAVSTQHEAGILFDQLPIETQLNIILPRIKQLRSETGGRIELTEVSKQIIRRKLELLVKAPKLTGPTKLELLAQLENCWQDPFFDLSKYAQEILEESRHGSSEFATLVIFAYKNRLLGKDRVDSQQVIEKYNFLLKAPIKPRLKGFVFAAMAGSYFQSGTVTYFNNSSTASDYCSDEKFNQLLQLTTIHDEELTAFARGILDQSNTHNFASNSPFCIPERINQHPLGKKLNELLQKDTAAYVAVKQGDIEQLNKAFSEGGNQNSRFHGGVSERKTLLHIAVDHANKEIIDWLALNLNLDRYTWQVDPRDGEYKTPLHHAAAGGYEAIVSLLLTAGADPEAVDETGKTPLDYAQTEQIRAAIQEKTRRKQPIPFMNQHVATLITRKTDDMSAMGHLKDNLLSYFY